MPRRRRIALGGPASPPPFPGPGTREWEEALAARREGMELFDSLPKAVREKIAEVDADYNDLLQLVMNYTPAEMIEIVKNWK